MTLQMMAEVMKSPVQSVMTPFRGREVGSHFFQPCYRGKEAFFDLGVIRIENNEAPILKSRPPQRPILRNLREISADIKNLSSLLGQPGTRRKFRQSLADLEDTLASARKSSDDLASQLENLPPDAVGTIARELKSTLAQINRVLTSVKGMVHELREEPGKILVIPKSQEPFQR